MDQQIARLNQQIADYNNRTELEKSRYDEFSKKVREYYTETQKLSQQTDQEPTDDDEALKSIISKDKDSLKDGYAFLEYERFKREIGDVQKPTDVNNLLNTAASFLIQFNEPMPKLISQREKRIDRCKKLESEIAAIQKDINPISQQVEDEIKESRQQTLAIQNKINFMQIDRINKRLQHFSDRYKRETEVSKLEGQIASSQTTYVYQKAALSGLQYVALLLKDGKQFTPDQIKQIKDHTDNFNKMLTFKDKDQYEKELSSISKAVKKLNKSRKEATKKINEILSGFSQIAQLDFSTYEKINANKNITNMIELENYKVTNEIKRLGALNNSLDSEIAEYKNDAAEFSVSNSKLEEEIQKSEEYRGKNENDMVQIEKQLKEKQESKEKLLAEHKSLESEYQKSSNDFISALTGLTKANISPELQKISEDLSSKIKNINVKINEVRVYEDIEKPLNTFLLKDVKQELEEIKKASETSEITNIQLFYNSQPNDMFSILRIPSIPFYVVKTAHAKLAFDALFYPNNIDPLYPSTLVTATLLGQYKDISLLASSIIALITNSIKTNLSNIDPNTRGPHSPQEMVKNFDKTHPFQFNKLIPYINENPLTLPDVVNRALTFLIRLIMIHPPSDTIRSEAKEMLKLVDEKVSSSKEKSTTLKDFLGLIVDPKTQKKKRGTINLKKVDDQIISFESAITEDIIDEKDRKFDIPITKVNMSIREKDLDRISYIDVKSISDNDFYNLFTYIQFNTYQKIAGVDLINKCRINQKPAHVENMINLHSNTIKFIKSQLNQSQGGKGGKGDDVSVCFKRWLRIATIALRENNLFFFQIIINSLNEFKDFDKIKSDLAKDGEILTTYNKYIDYLKNESDANNLLSEVRKSYNDEKSKRWFYIPSFQGNFSSINNLNNLISKKDAYKVKDFKLQLKYVRDIAEQLYFSLSAINNKFTFSLNPDIVRGLEKRLAPSTEG